MTKRVYSEKVFREYLDSVLPRGITIGKSFYRNAKEYEQKDNAFFRYDYNCWLDGLEKDGIETGIYSKTQYKTMRGGKKN